MGKKIMSYYLFSTEVLTGKISDSWNSSYFCHFYKFSGVFFLCVFFSCFILNMIFIISWKLFIIQK